MIKRTGKSMIPHPTILLPINPGLLVTRIFSIGARNSLWAGLKRPGMFGLKEVIPGVVLAIQGASMCLPTHV